MRPTQDINILGFEPLVSPRSVRQQYSQSAVTNQVIAGARKGVQRILSGDDKRLLAIVGPCSIHDYDAAMEYAGRLAELSRRVENRIMIIMRVYFEKPRTTVGWKGMINDPHMDGSFDVTDGLRTARKMLLDIAEMHLPAGTEMLDPITPQYIADLVAWSSIGARTAESPTHRQMASGLSMPVGFKNGTDGNIQTAINAMLAAKSPHSFLGIDANGRISLVNTRGNTWGHLILRGGRDGPNYSAKSLGAAAEQLAAVGFGSHIVVDCSHDNSGKDPEKQPAVWSDVLSQRLAGNRAIVGMMLESNLQPGKQPPAEDPAQLEYGVSITDACLGWERTEELILETHAALR